MSLKNARCPFLISHRPLVRLPSEKKIHPHQVLPRRLQDMFSECRDAVGITCQVWPDPSTLHEIRNLVSALAADAGYAIEEIRSAMARTDARTTRTYQSAHDLPYTKINIQVTKEIQGGRDFKE